MNSIDDIWASVLEVVAKDLTPTSMKTWFSDSRAVDLGDGVFVTYTENGLLRNVVMSRFAGIIKGALKELFSCDFDFVMLAEDELEEYWLKKKNEDAIPEMDGYTFENFIVGSCNKYAHAAALGVVKSPGSRMCNPLFIYGNSGLGKTHLLCAIGSAIHEKDPKAKIVYVKGDDFTNQMIKSIKEGSSEEFRKKYRDVDLFLVDDIQFIAGKEATQEEFFHTFNNIYEAGHQIVVTSDRPPMDMLKLEDRLRTRFEGGLMADVQPPDLETRMAIIRNKSGHLGMALSDAVVQYIAEKLTSNVRQIEGVIKRLTAFRELTDESINTEDVDRAIKDVVRMGTYIPTPEDIIEECAHYYKLEYDDIVGQRRLKNITRARHISCYLIRNLTNMSLNDIGKIFNRDHSTILASVKLMEKEIVSNGEINATIRDITSNINSRQK